MFFNLLFCWRFLLSFSAFSFESLSFSKPKSPFPLCRPRLWQRSVRKTFSVLLQSLSYWRLQVPTPWQSEWYMTGFCTINAGGFSVGKGQRWQEIRRTYPKCRTTRVSIEVVRESQTTSFSLIRRSRAKHPKLLLARTKNKRKYVRWCAGTPIILPGLLPAQSQGWHLHVLLASSTPGRFHLEVSNLCQRPCWLHF